MHKVFEKIGPENTEETLALALQRAEELDTDIVVASSKGDTALKLWEMARQRGFKGKLVDVRLVNSGGKNPMPEEVAADLRSKGVVLITAAHVLSGAERGISHAHGGIYPVELMADTLRMISRGVKVCVEIAVMALDAGEIPFEKPVVCIGGSGKGADSACVVTPSYAADILKTRVNEIICKPFNV